MIKIIKSKKLIFALALGLIIAGGVFYILSGERCEVQAEERIVRGGSLSPLIESGDTVKVLFGYYNCHKIKRNDVVAYYYAGNKDPLIKIVRGVSGDKFELRETDRGWNILINGQILKNSEGNPYLVAGKDYEMLSLYEKDYGESLPENTYLLLGNMAGSIDSRRFGLVDKSDILGKVEY